MRRRLLATTGTILALSLGVAACSQEVEPTVAPPTTSAEASTEPTTSEAETTPPTPDVPKPDPADFPGKNEQTEEGAQQAVRYYWAMLLWGYQTGETEELESLYSSACGNCSENVEDIHSLAGEDQLWSRAKVADEGVITQSSDSFDHEIAYNFRLDAHEEYDPKSSGRIDIPAKYYSTGTGLSWDDGRWLVGGVNFEIEDY